MAKKKASSLIPAFDQKKVSPFLAAWQREYVDKLREERVRLGAAFKVSANAMVKKFSRKLIAAGASLKLYTWENKDGTRSRDYGFFFPNDVEPGSPWFSQQMAIFGLTAVGMSTMISQSPSVYGNWLNGRNWPSCWIYRIKDTARLRRKKP